MSMGNKILQFLGIMAIGGFFGAIIIVTAKEKAPELFAKYQVISLEGSTFDLDVTVLITDDTAFAVNYVRENLDSTAKSQDFDARAVTFTTLDGKPPIIWMPYHTPVDVVNHELMHATADVMRWAGVPLTDTTEEVYAYELQYLSDQFFKQIKPTK